MGISALLSVNYGTTVAQTREATVDAIDAHLEAAFSDRAFYRAWASERVALRLREGEGVWRDTLAEAFARLADDGVDDLIVATSCLMAGFEARKVEGFARGWVASGTGRRVRLADPLLAARADCEVLAQAVSDEFEDVPEGEALLLMGHGAPDGPNEPYAYVQEALHALGRERFFMGTVAGEPTFDDAAALLQASGAWRVWLAPFMIVAGDHARNDLVGPGEDSWQSRLRALGFETRAVLRGLGEYAGVRDLVCAHAHAARELQV